MNDKPSRFRLSNLLWSIACFAAIFAIVRFNLRLNGQTSGTDNLRLVPIVVSPIPIAVFFGGGVGVLFGRFMLGAFLGLTSIFLLAASCPALLWFYYSWIIWQ